MYISILSPEKGQNITIITRKSEKIVMSFGGFLRKFYFLTAVTLKFYKKSNFSSKNNMFSTFSRKIFAKKI